MADTDDAAILGSNPEVFSTADLDRLRRRLRRWYDEHGRDLPWRWATDPYHIWLSEIMLQQTTVAAVIPYYERFLARFPEVKALAAADEADVLRLWEGLGYYSRARNIHRAARQIVDQHGGQFPRSVEQLRALPGIGRYTAGAIASFAFDLPAPIVEANTQRLYARLLGWKEDLKTTASQALLWSFAEQIVPRRGPGKINQALMELGSQVCTPVSPACQLCPLQLMCRAHQSGLQHEIPPPKIKSPPTAVTHLCVALDSNGQYLLQQYPSGERWAGLWDFLRWEANDFPLAELPQKQSGAKSLFREPDLWGPVFRRVEQQFRERTGMAIEVTGHLLTHRHAVTRYAITLVGFTARMPQQATGTGFSQLEWIDRERISKLPLSTTGRKLANLLPGT